MKRDTHRMGRDLVAVGILAILLAACSGQSTPAPTSAGTGLASASPALASGSAAAFDLGSIQDSVAYIETQGTFVTADGTSEKTYTGSGFVVDPSGLVVTNNHVVTGGAFWKVTIGADKTLHDARLLGVSECSDLAVLQVTGGGTYPVLPFAAADPTVGEQIYVAGHPNGDPYTLTNGIVAKPPAPADTSWASVHDQIQITAQTFPGNSGSPVIDAAGRVVGVQYAGGLPGTAIAGESFAIAAGEAKGVIDQIRAKGNLDYIGLNGEVNADNTGIAVISVAPGSPADKAGIVAGDLLTNFNGASVGTDGSKSTYCSVLRSHNSGDTLTFAVTRGGATLTGEINGRPIAAVAATPPPATSAPAITPAPATPTPSGSSTANDSIDRLQPFIPAATWSTCIPSTTGYAASVQTAQCSASGVDGIWYDFFGSRADAQAAFDADISAYSATQTDKSLDQVCASENWYGTWYYGTPPPSPDPGRRILCATSDTGAWLEQIDPKTNVLATAHLKSGDAAGLYKWWTKNTLVVEPAN